LREFLLHSVYLPAAEQAPLAVLHLTGRDHSDHAFGQAAKDYKSRPAVERRAQGYVSPLTSSPDLVVAAKDLFDLSGVN
jgi:hypothetical protein